LGLYRREVQIHGRIWAVNWKMIINAGRMVKSDYRSIVL
jgi:hypothetical protein